MTTAPMLSPAQIKDAIAASLALPYEPEPGSPFDARYAGMTNLEVMLHKRAQAAARSGSIDGSESLLDRAIGKPVAKAESLRVTVGYEDFLKDVARKVAPPAAGAEAQRPAVVDAEVVYSDPGDPLAP